MATYSTLAEIGRGGFGVVERVRDSRGRTYARKTFRPGSYIPKSAYDSLRKRFIREVKIQAELGGDEILPVLDSDLNGDFPSFVMPLAEKTYDEQIQSDLSAGRVDIDAIADILNGLEYLHNMGYVHRDLNPKNILLHEGRWKLSDLGAVLPPSGKTVTLTEGTVIYTEQYCSPEQRNDFHRAQPSADIFAFGCILHDLFGAIPRTPYSQQHAPGPIGVVIEKCTDKNPARRPNVKVLRNLVLDILVEEGAQCKVTDEQSGSWLKKLEDIESWTDSDFGDFGRYFATLNIQAREAGHENEWVYSLSTPFLTRLPVKAVEYIAKRSDGISEGIVERYCEWAGSTAFLFHFADTVCSRLDAIFEHGTPQMKAMAISAMIRLADSHHRFHVMRTMLERCSSGSLTRALSRRLAIEIRTEELETKFKRCAEIVKWDVGQLSADLAKFCS